MCEVKTNRAYCKRSWTNQKKTLLTATTAATTVATTTTIITISPTKAKATRIDFTSTTAATKIKGIKAKVLRVIGKYWNCLKLN